MYQLPQIGGRFEISSGKGIRRRSTVFEVFGHQDGEAHLRRVALAGHGHHIDARIGDTIRVEAAWLGRADVRQVA